MFHNPHLTDNVCLSEYPHGNVEPTGKLECSDCVSCLHPINSQNIWKGSDQMEWINLKNINGHNVFPIEIYVFAEMGRFLSFWEQSPFPWENRVLLLCVVGIRFGPSRYSEGYFAMCCTTSSQTEPGAQVEVSRSRRHKAGCYGRLQRNDELLNMFNLVSHASPSALSSTLPALPSSRCPIESSKKPRSSKHDCIS